ncbi:MAG TPA: 4Fe-4S double cluster binding domain-containing protein [Spirochaetia bacterium]|nr:4Fe-4S double cluster binding domain-containing protein [Spirochaetia bacterium]
MLTKIDIIGRALKLGFADAGFTTVEPFAAQRDVLRERQELYAWAGLKGLDLMQGTEPGVVCPQAKTIVVLLENYFKEGFPAEMVGKFGRQYLDDDRMTKDRLFLRLQAFRTFLQEDGIESTVLRNLPHRLAAARAGLGTFGKNCLLFANRAVRQGSWVTAHAILIDHAFEPDVSTMEVGCPDWCRNACITACPTRALLGPRKIDPRRCISYLTYYGEGITPLELREPMGMWVYGCDHCQNVCPRNQPWLAQALPVNEKVAAMVPDFALERLLHMDLAHFEARVRPHMFYMPPQEMWRWQMNAARAMGNSRDTAFVPDLARALRENTDERVKGMAAWALGRVGGPGAKQALETACNQKGGLVAHEIREALEQL